MYTANNIKVNKKIIPDGNKLKANKTLTGGKPKFVTIHNTPEINEAAGTTDAEQYSRATYNGNMGGVVPHYYIDKTDCWQLLNDTEVGWHAADGATGPGNTTSVAIEIIMSADYTANDKKAEERGAKLAAYILNKYGLGIDALTTHKRWYPKKYCPAYILPHWDSFKKQVETELENLSADNKKTTAKLYRVQCGAFAKRENAEKLKKELEKKGYEAVIV